MVQAQIDRFNQTSGTTMTQMSDAIALIIGMLILFWLAWLAFGLFDSWRKREIESGYMTWGILRGAVVVMILTWYIR